MERKGCKGKKEKGNEQDKTERDWKLQQKRIRRDKAHNVDNIGQDLHDLAGFVNIWHDLTRFDRIWQNLTSFNRI